MTEENKDNWNNLLIGIVGSIIGGLVVFMLLKSKLESQPSTLQLQQHHQQVYQMQNRIQELESELYQQDQRQYQHQQSYQQPYLYQQSYQQPNKYSQSSYGTYKNNEKWAITRNKEGFISNIEVIRDAKVS